MASALAPAVPRGPSLRVHKRAPFDNNTEAVTGGHLQKDPQGTSLLKSRARRDPLPLDRTENKSPGTPSPPHVLCIWPVSEVCRACGACSDHSSKKNKSWRRCHWADLCPVPSGLGYETQYLVDANGALPPPARSVVPAISTDCHRSNARSSVADRRAPMRQSTSRPQDPPMRVKRASQPSPRRLSLRPPPRPSRSGCWSLSL